MDSETSMSFADWLTYGADYNDIVCFGVTEKGKIAALLSGYSGGEHRAELLLLTEANIESADRAEASAGQENGQEETPDAAAQTLTLAAFNLDVMMQGYIADYNKSHPECTIEVVDYGEGDAGAGMTRLNADIVAGNVPDIIELSNVDVGLYAALGILTDLSPYLEAEEEFKREDLIDSALSMHMADGKLYGIPAGVMAETLMAYSEETVGREEWTTEEFQAALARLPEGAEMIDNLSALGMLRIQLSMNMDQYIDYKTGTCSFDGESFRELLEFSMTLGEGTISDVPEEERLADGSLLLHRSYLDGVSAFVSEAGLFHGESIQCVGYPSADGGHSYLTPYGTMGITEACEDKAAAWDFVRSLLTEEFQKGYMHFQIPTLRSVIEEELDEAQEMEKNMRESDPSYIPVLSEENTEAFWEMINTGKTTNSFNRDVWNMI